MLTALIIIGDNKGYNSIGINTSDIFVRIPIAEIVVPIADNAQFVNNKNKKNDKIFLGKLKFKIKINNGIVINWVIIINIQIESILAIKILPLSIGDSNNKLNAKYSFSELYNLRKPIIDVKRYVNQKIPGKINCISNEIGLIVLLNESSLGSNLRRVEMLSGYEAYDFMTNAYNSYKNVSNILKTNINEVPTKLATF